MGNRKGGKGRGRSREAKNTFFSARQHFVFPVSRKQQTNLFKASSVAENSREKDFPISRCHNNPLCEHPKGTTSDMDVQGREFSSELSIKSRTIGRCHNHMGSNSTYSLLSEKVNGKVPTLAPGKSQHLEMLKENANETTEVLKNNDLGCEDENISCISKADGISFGVGCYGEIDQKNMTGSSASVNSLHQKCSDKLVDVQSAKYTTSGKGSPEYTREALQSAADVSDRLNPSETSFRAECSGVVSPKVEIFSPGRDTVLLADNQKCCHDPVDMKTGTEVNGIQTSSVALHDLDQKEHIDMRMRFELQEPPLQYCAIRDNETSDELVDVRLCDICGDVGREAMLAVCSKCSDGAEHIYCMRVKMDKVPEDDWICEECMIMEEAQNQKADEQNNEEALQKLSAEVPQNLRKLDHDFYNGRAGVGHAFLASSGKRPGANSEMSSSAKKRKLHNGVKLESPPGSCAKGASSLGRDSLGNILQKAHQPLAGKSSNIESQFYKGSLFKQKCGNRTASRTTQKVEDVYTSKGSLVFRPGLQNANLRKSKSFTASKVASLDTSASRKNLHYDLRNPKFGSKCSSTQRSYSFNSKIHQPASPFVSSSISRIKLAKVEVKQVPKSFHDRRIADVQKDVMDKDSIDHLAKRQFDKNKQGFRTTLTCSTAEKGRSPQSCVRTSSGCLRLKADKKTANMEPEPVSKDRKLQLNNNVQLKKSPSHATVHLAEFVHPKEDCVWRVIFNVKGCSKLPVSYTQLQAHLSSCASPKVHQVMNKFPRVISVDEVLQRDVWAAQSLENFATEDNIALYFFAEDLQSYQSYKRLLNCMMLHKVALKSNFDDFELLIFPSQILPARSQRWNDLFFLWGVFRAKKLGFQSDACVPSPLKATQICNANVPRCLPSSNSPKSKCLEGSPFSEVDDEMMASALIMLKEQRCGHPQTKKEGKEENRSQNQDLEVKIVDVSSPSISGAEIPAQPDFGKDPSITTQRKLQASIDLNHPYNELSPPIYEPTDAKELPEHDIMTDGGSFSLNSGVSDSGGVETLEKAMDRHDLNLSLSLWPEIEHANVEAGIPLSLDLSLALPSKDDNPAPVTKQLLPEKNDVDTSLFSYFRR